ncbi:MAG: hypothetical protein IJF37_06950 [Lachnospiraceae bacterium]|nr:hypothetical protein [Lachnospiraceae bacterium]
MADTYTFISLITFILSGVFLLITGVLFCTLNIRKIVGDISGHNARRFVEERKMVVSKPEIQKNIYDVKNITSILTEGQLMSGKDKIYIEKDITYIHVKDNLSILL